MSAHDKPPAGLSLKRWSQRKFEAARARNAPDTSAHAVAAPAAVAAAPVDIAQPVAAPGSATTLPPVESLTIDSDFTPFFRSKVGEALKRQALKQLFRDPRFNVMDGLDVYVGDYSIPDPISADVVKQMVQGRYIFDPPATRINAQGQVEDVPPEEAAPGDAADGVARAAGQPALSPTPEAGAAALPLAASAPEAEAAPSPLPPTPVQAATPGTAVPAPRELAAGAAPRPDPGLSRPPTR